MTGKLLSEQPTETRHSRKYAGTAKHAHPADPSRRVPAHHADVWTTGCSNAISTQPLYAVAYIRTYPARLTQDQLS